MSKKRLIARTLGVGIARIHIDDNAKEEIEQAMTRQDIKELKKQGIIKILPIIGRHKAEKKGRRGKGSVKKKVHDRRQYVKVTRKLRSYLKKLKAKGMISNEKYNLARKKIKSRAIKNFQQIKEAMK